MQNLLPSFNPQALQALIALLQLDGADATTALTSRGGWVGELLLDSSLPASWSHYDFDACANMVFTERFEVVVVVLPAGHKLSALERNVITKARDVLAHKVLVLLPAEGVSFDLQNELRSLALSALMDTSFKTQTQSYSLWHYNIINYKQVPDWLNSKFWANPQNWNKYRW